MKSKVEVKYRITYCLKCGGIFTYFISNPDEPVKEACILCGHSWNAVREGEVKEGEIK